MQSSFDWLQWHNREDDPPIPRLAPPPSEASSTRRPPKTPTAPPVRHVQFAISNPPSPGVDDEAVLSPTRQSVPHPLAGSSVSAALEDDDLEEAQQVGGEGWALPGVIAAVHSPCLSLQEAEAAKVPFLKKSVAVMEATMWWVTQWSARHWVE